MPCGHESLTIIVRDAPILVSVLESYRFCPLTRYFISLSLIKYQGESCEAPRFRFSPASFASGIAAAITTAHKQNFLLART